MKKNIYPHACTLFAFGCFFLILVTGCKKNNTVVIPAVTSSFSMKDSLKIEPQYATLAPEIYNKYNGKTYVVNSSNKVMFAVQKMGTDVMFYFQDTSVYPLYPTFRIMIKNTHFGSLLPEYNLTNATQILLEYYQSFIDFTTGIHLHVNVKSGALKIAYNSQYNTVSGEINDLKVPLDFYAPDDPVPSATGPSGILMLNGGSTRTVNLKYDYVRINN